MDYVAYYRVMQCGCVHKLELFLFQRESVCVCVCVVRPRESTKTKMQNEYNQVHLIYRLCKQNKMQQ